MSLQAKKYDDVVIAKARTSLLHFIQGCYRFQLKDSTDTENDRNSAMEFIVAPHHIKIAHALEQVLIGSIIRLIINIPPRFSKTEMVKHFIAWALGQYPDSQFIYACYSASLATGATAGIRNIVESDFYKAVFPHVHLDPSAYAKDEWYTTARGMVYGVGLEGTIAGRGAGLTRETFGGAMIVDDPNNPTDATSKALKENVLANYRASVDTRLNSTLRTPIIIIMQRVAEDDLVGWILKHDMYDWTVIRIAAIKKDGTALWEEKCDLKFLENKKRTSPEVFYPQYMQEIVALGKKVFGDFKFYNSYTLPTLSTIAIVADTAQKTGETNDYTVFMVVGLGIDFRLYILDVIRDRFDSTDLRIRAHTLWARWKQHSPPCHGFYVEDKVSGTGLIQTLQNEGIVVHAINTVGNLGKPSRALATASHVTAGNVLIPEDAAWVEEFIAEVNAFDMLMRHTHDDQVDALMHSIQLFLNDKRIPTGINIGKWGLWEEENYPFFYKRFISVVTPFINNSDAIKTNAITSWGLFRNNETGKNCLMLTDYWHDWADYPQFKQIIMQANKRLKPHAVVLEYFKGELQLLNDIRKEQVPIFPIRKRVSQRGEIMAIIGNAFESNLIYIPNKSWARDFAIYLRSYPNGSTPCFELSLSTVHLIGSLINFNFEKITFDDKEEKELEFSMRRRHNFISENTRRIQEEKTLYMGI